MKIFNLILFALLITINSFAQTSLHLNADDNRIQTVLGMKPQDTVLIKNTDGNIRDYSVKNYYYNEDGSMIVEFSQAVGKIVVDFEGEGLTYQAGSLAGDKASSLLNKSAFFVATQGLLFDLAANNNLRIINESFAKINEYNEKINRIIEDINSKQISFNLKISILNQQLLQVHSSSLPAVKLDYYNLDSSSTSLNNFVFRSQDDEFLKQAKKIQSGLLNAKITTSIDRGFYNIAFESLKLSDFKSLIGDKDQADFLLNISKTALDVLLGVDPFTGIGRSIYEGITGYNIITGDVLTPTERAFALIGILSGGYAIKAYRLFNVVSTISKKISPHLISKLNLLNKITNKTGNGFVMGTSSVVRKINLRSSEYKSFGFTKKHLNKHFFGNSRFALKNIDPAGTPSQWMVNIAELSQGKAFKTYKNNAFDIYNYYQKSDKTGFYRMGVRLMKKEDNTYDLITVLTDQKRRISP